MNHYDSDDEIELRALLKTVSDKGLKALTIAELDRLRGLLEAKDYGDNKRADKSKRKLLKQINSTFYDRHRPSRLL